MECRGSAGIPRRHTTRSDYVGVKGNHLHRVVDGNAPIPALVPRSCAICARVESSLRNSERAECVLGSLGGTAVRSRGGRSSFPVCGYQQQCVFHAIVEKSIASSIYHGLQTTFKRFSHGLLLSGRFYTYSHSIDDSRDTIRPEFGNLVFRRILSI